MDGRSSWWMKMHSLIVFGNVADMNAFHLQLDWYAVTQVHAKNAV